MKTLSPWQRVYYTYLARMYAFTYSASNRSVLGMTIRAWIVLAGLVLLAAGWIMRWPLWLLALIALILLWLVVSFWLARRSNYTRFVASDEELMAAADLTAVAPNTKVPVQATGAFSVSGYGRNVLFRPAQYWQVPLGDHIVMVEDRPNKFLYQFFNASSLQSVASGWLLFGGEPEPAMSVSFLSKWGPEYTKFQAYDDGQDSPLPAKQVTIYLTFASEADYHNVWHTVVADARRARE